MSEQRTGHPTGPTGPGSVVLELGENIGALILATPPDLAGHEIDISPRAGGPRTHSLVRERHTGSHVSYAAVYPVLTAGEYTVWGDDGTPAGQVTIRGGQASHFRWPPAASASGASTNGQPRTGPRATPGGSAPRSGWWSAPARRRPAPP